MSETLLRLTRLLACVAHHASTVARKNASEPKGAPTTHELSLKQVPETSQAPQFGQSDRPTKLSSYGTHFLTIRSSCWKYPRTTCSNRLLDTCGCFICMYFKCILKNKYGNSTHYSLYLSQKKKSVILPAVQRHGHWAVLK